MDAFVIFQQPLRDIRNFFSSLTIAEDYQMLKNIYLETIEQMGDKESPGDERVYRPYLVLALTNATAKSLKIR